MLVREYEAALSHAANARRPGLWARCATLYLACGDFSGAVAVYNRLAVSAPLLHTALCTLVVVSGGWQA